MPTGFTLPGQRSGDVWAKALLNPPTRRGPFFLTLLARVSADSSVETAEAPITTAVTPVLRDRYGIKTRGVTA